MISAESMPHLLMKGLPLPPMNQLTVSTTPLQIYGFALKYAKNIFVLFEIVGSLLSIVFATSLSFKVLGNDLKINPHFIKILLYLVINLFVFFIAAWLEWDFIFG